MTAVLEISVGHVIKKRDGPPCGSGYLVEEKRVEKRDPSISPHSQECTALVRNRKRKAWGDVAGVAGMWRGRFRSNLFEFQKQTLDSTLLTGAAMSAMVLWSKSASVQKVLRRYGAKVLSEWAARQTEGMEKDGPINKPKG